MENIVKTFPGGVTANDNVDLSVRNGEIHGLLGENGAGKSTLMNVLYGLYTPDSGEIYFNDEQLDLGSPQEAIEAGIGMVHQHFMLVPRLSVIQNVVLGERESPGWARRIAAGTGRIGWALRGLTMDTAAPRAELIELAEEYGIDADPDKRVWELDVGEQQRVEILKALYRDVDLLILDEPTAVLTPLESERLFETLKKLTDQGLSIIFITHKLEEITGNTDRVTVLRDGKHVDTVDTATVTEAELAEMMVGREVLFHVEREARTLGESVLTVSDLHAEDERGVEVVRGVDLDLKSGEVVGVAGVSGNGQREFAECLAGVREPTAGSIRMQGAEFAGKRPSEYIDGGVSYIPEDRLEHGCAPNKTVRENLIIKNIDAFRDGLFLDTARTREYAERLVEEFDIRVSGIDVEAEKLSGGNLQKLIVARELDRDPEVLIANQPTRGVDVGAIEYIRSVLLEQRKEGTPILLISENFDELTELSDRIVVMFEGRIVHETPVETANRARISQYMNRGKVVDADPSADAGTTAEAGPSGGAE